MKFILGYIRGSQSRENPARPVLHMAVRAYHDGKDYIFERLKKEGSLVLPELVIHDSDGVPQPVIDTLLITEQIIPLDFDGNPQRPELKATGR